MFRYSVQKTSPSFLSNSARQDLSIDIKHHSTTRSWKKKEIGDFGWYWYAWFAIWTQKNLATLHYTNFQYATSEICRCTMIFNNLELILSKL